MIYWFFQTLEISKHMRKCNFQKSKGKPLKDVFLEIFQLIFKGKNFYRALEAGETTCSKDMVYRFLNNPQYNWRRFLFMLSGSTIQKLLIPLTSKDRVKVLILDDSLFERLRSKKVELLAKVYDHVSHKYVWGYRMLTLGWSDGATFLPLAFSNLSSPKEKNRVQEMKENLDRRSMAYKRRAESLQKATEVGIELMRQALRQKLQASYVLFDSWFSSPKMIAEVRELGLHVICRLKAMPRIYYRYNGEELNLNALYKKARKEASRGDILASVHVEITSKGREDLPAKIVFVRRKGSGKELGEGVSWIAILTTDCHISDEEAVRIYGIRWDIEVFFKSTKSFLGLAKEFQGRSYDLLVAHTSIVFTRYIMLAIKARQDKDGRTFGVLFYHCYDEVKNMDLASAMTLILLLLEKTLAEFFVGAEERLQEVLRAFKSLLPLGLQDLQPNFACES
jgi:hypothetical protein